MHMRMTVTKDEIERRLKEYEEGQSQAPNHNSQERQL